MSNQDHYQILGVRRSASTTDIRRSYVALARRFHPDRQQPGGAEEIADAQARMQLINEAWRVLSDGARRAEFDAATAPKEFDGLVPSESPPTVAEDSGGFMVTPRMAMVLRVGPWVLAASLALGLVVLTAYAGGSRGDGGGGVSEGDCIVFQGPGAYTEVSCRGEHDGVVATITFGQCAADERAFHPRSSDATFCLVGGG